MIRGAGGAAAAFSAARTRQSVKNFLRFDSF